MKKLFITFLISLSPLAFDLDYIKSKGYEVYQIESGESLNEIAHKLYKKSDYKFQSPEDFEKLLRKWNPHLSRVSNISGQYIYVSNPHPPYLEYKWAPDLYINEGLALANSEYDYVDRTLGKRSELAASSERMPANNTSTQSMVMKKKSNWVRFVHATISQGQFIDDIDSNKINSQQNSPFTVGAGFVYLPESWVDWSLASSAYYSNLKAAEIKDQSNTVQNTNINLPAEIGANLYLQRTIPGRNYSFYGGIDYERFNSLNFKEILNGETATLNNEQQAILFATLGTAITFDFFKPTTFKFSLSTGVQSQTEMNGFKYMLYFNQKLTKNFWYHVLYKQHLLEEGTRKVNIARYGIGIGVAF
ncbi:hypothetical protein [Bacteriovorax sp. Seq25_V]|uniref:hypothetical protein n=1 Tax=Bacteriovorax sp. Seq25_V TaxID=1201288 RepID=UPI00038A1937|nr:hypothetical protein [Bacteriovorax sp. Seq25_V]EQC45481.1 hypothetical protein M900_2189 [Bacteriovorax sp. Seq25_V]